jgi:hypothetical protein
MMAAPRFSPNRIRPGENPELVSSRNFESLVRVTDAHAKEIEASAMRIAEIGKRVKILDHRLLSPVFNVLDYGAKGDGVTDDYAALLRCFTAASAAKGQVWIPKGTYILSQPLDLPGSNLWIDGDTQAIIRAKTGGAFTNASDNWVFRINGFSNMVIKNIILDGNKSGNPTGRTFGLDVQGNSDNVTCENVSFVNCPGSVSAGTLGGDGCRVGQTGATPTNIQFLECDFDGNVRTGIGLITGDHILVSGCTLRNTSGTNLGVGIDMEPDPSGTPVLRNIRIVGNTVYNNAGGGIGVVSTGIEDMTGIVISNNTVYSNGSTSSTFGQIFINGHRQGLIISGNTITSDFNAGLYLFASAAVQVTGNNFRGAYASDEDKCIRMYSNSGGDIQNISIVGNMFSGTGQSAIFLDANLAGTGNIDGVIIQSNMFRDCVRTALAASTPVVYILADVARTIKNVVIQNNVFMDTRGTPCDYILVLNSDAQTYIDTFVISGNTHTGFGAGNPYSGTSADNIGLRDLRILSGKTIVFSGDRFQLDNTLAIRAGTSSGSIKTGGTLRNQVSDADNALAAETDLHTYTLSASTLSATNDYVEWESGGVFANNANNKQIRAYFNGTLIYDTTALAFQNTSWRLRFRVTRSGSSGASALAEWISEDAALKSASRWTSVTGITWTGAIIAKTTGTATANGDITEREFCLKWMPGWDHLG